MTELFADFPRYLSAKKALDDRSLNRHVYGEMARRLAKFPPQHALRVLDLGAGLGSMAARLQEWGFPHRLDYTALDSRPDFPAQAAAWLMEWARTWDFEFSQPEPTLVNLTRNHQQVSLRLLQADIHAYLAGPVAARFDLLLGHAVLDLLPLDAVLPPLLNRLQPGGLFYFTLNFDGATILEPALDPEFDELIERRYHQTMDERSVNGRPAGHSRTGRRLFSALHRAGGQVLAAGSSDWVVFPAPHGYTGDEAFFLHYILETMHHGLLGLPGIDAPRFTGWIAARHAQIDRAELTYIAHQLDLLGMLPVEES